LLKSAILQSPDILVSFDVLSLSSEIRSIAMTLTERCVSQVGAILELLQFCPRTTSFQSDDKLVLQKDCIVIGSVLSLIGSNFHMGILRNWLWTRQHKASLWLCYDHTVVAWLHGFWALFWLHGFWALFTSHIRRVSQRSPNV
jgi:hypothetical protein